MFKNFLIAIAFISLFFNLSVYAQTATAPSVGDGSAGSPYEIASLNNLYWITASDVEVPSPNQVTRWAAYYIQTAGIDASTTSTWNSGAGWVAIGNSTNKFSGSYNGQGYTLNNLYINNSTNTYNGLFGYTNVASLSNIKLIDIDFNTSTGNLSGLCCEFFGGTMSSCSVTGSLTASGYCGGVCCDIGSSAIVEKCSFTGDITANGLLVGGIIAQSNTSTNIIKECWTAGNIYGASTTSTYVGGIVGYDRATVQNCYSTAKVFKNGTSSSVGGVVGYAHNSTKPTITNCYSTGPLKSVIGSGTVTAATGVFWDSQTSNVSSATYGTAKTTSEMKTSSTFIDAGWDFSTLWARDDSKNGGYPYLQFQSFPNSTVITDGNTFNNNVNPGQSDQPIGRFALSSVDAGSIFNYIWITLNGTRSGSSSFKIWVSNDDVFDSGIDTQIGTTVNSDPGAGNQIFFTALNQSLSASDKYYFLTSNLTAGATGDIQAIISGDKDLMLGYSTAISSISNISLSTSAIPLPVELDLFNANVSENNINLYWQTATEVNNYGFEVERKILKQVQNDNAVWEKLGFVNGNGNSNSSKDYSFVDTKVSTGKYSYRLKQIDNDGQFEYSKTIEVDFNAPNKFELSQNYPNPFNPSTTIRFNLPEASIVKLTIFNILGQEIRTLVNEFRESGINAINFDASDLNSGMYIYKIEAGNFVQTRKMTLLK